MRQSVTSKKHEGLQENLQKGRCQQEDAEPPMWPTVLLRLGGTAEGDRTQMLNGFFPSACTEEGGCIA